MARKKKKKETFDYGALIALVFTVFLMVISISKSGFLGNFISNVFNYLCGPYYLVCFISLCIVLLIKIFLNKLFLKKDFDIPVWFYIGLVFLNIAVMILGAHLIYKDTEILELPVLRDILFNITKVIGTEGNYGGGLIGSALLFGLYNLISKNGTTLLLVLLYMLSAILIIPLGIYKAVINYMKDTSSKVITSAKNTHEKISEGIRHKQALREEEREKRRIERERNINIKDTPKDKAPDPFHVENEQLEITDPENVSEFTKTYFIKDALTKEKKPSAFESEPKEDKNIEVVDTSKTRVSKTKAIKKHSGPYRLPPLSILEPNTTKNSKTNKASADVKGKKLIEVLSTFGIDAKLVNIHIGPSVTKFEVKPDSNIKVNKIMSIQDNIKMELAVTDVRIEAPIPGRSAVGIEIPNAEMSSVRMSELMPKVKDNANKLLFALGKDLMGEQVYCELNKMPHLLIGGATGSGKSVCINTIICSLLLRSDPDTVKLVLIDPKKVEFAPYHDLPHLMWPVITESDKAAILLKRLVMIMEERYETFATVQVRDISGYNEFVERHNRNLEEDEAPLERMPFIVVIIDELADLMAVAKNEVQLSIQRFTQLARACGMHMIVATQRPSTDVITGLIKSNIPSRISFAVSSSIDSRTILDSVGAEKLLGMGDMLYLPQGEISPSRIQGAYVSDSEIRKITEYVKAQASPQYDDAYYSLERANDGSFAFTGEGGNTKDPLYDEIVEYVVDAQKASTSLLQRRFGIGYNRSARIIDQLEENGIIGSANGSKPREVLIKKEE
ncbi:MAG: DUF87 domain-containing protein [Erysipelotrichaceae bacterium]|nr:DUF87 domain-containing protein [Erysipelotrichaceae bacterium]